MEPQARLTPIEPRRPTALRATVASIVIIALLVLSVGYHDGLFWTDPLASASAPGSYRFKGVITHYDPSAQEILLQDGDEQRNLHWNITQPTVGRVYVVDAEVLDDGNIEALALTPVFLFR